MEQESESTVQIKGQTDQVIVLQGDSNYTVGTAKFMYKQPEIYMVPLHEVSDIAQEDWFLETVNIIAGVLLGVALERILTLPELSWAILAAVSAAILAYRIYRRYRQDKKIANLKEKAIPFEVTERTKRTKR